MKRISLDRTSGRVIRGDDVEITLKSFVWGGGLGNATERARRRRLDYRRANPRRRRSRVHVMPSGQGACHRTPEQERPAISDLVFGVLPDLPRVQRKTYAWSSAFHPRLLGVIFTLVGLVLGDFVLSPILAAEQRKVVISTSLTLTVLFPYFMTLGPLFVCPRPDGLAAGGSPKAHSLRFDRVSSAVGAGGALYALIQHKLAVLGYSEHW